MPQIQNLAATLVFLGVLVFVHESGHFLVAKFLNVKVLKFSIGFGPRVFGFTRGETEYAVSWIPLGGYVKMAGELPFEELSPEESKRGFLAQPPWKRALIVGAGPFFNLVFPVLAYFVVFLGAHPFTSTRIGSVEPGLPAGQAKLEPGDYIRKVDGVEVKTFEELKGLLQNAYDRELTLTVERAGQTFIAHLTPSKTVESNPIEKVTRGMIGISPYTAAPILGVPAGSAAERAGLQTFDRVLSVNGIPVKDELQLKAAVEKLEGTLAVKVARMSLVELPGASAQLPSVVSVDVPRQPGASYAALGAERGDLYVSNVTAGSPAAAAGVKPGDRLLEFNGRPILSYNTLYFGLQEVESRPFTLKWRSGTEEKSQQMSQAMTEVHDELNQSLDVLDLGITPRVALARPEEAEKIILHMGVGQAFAASIKIVPEVIRQTAIVIGKLFTGGVPFKSVGGPLMLYKVASKSAEAGLSAFIRNMAVLSVNLGLMNLLPIPVLDGFQLLAAFWEGVRRRPIPVKAREVANMIGLAMLAVIMVMVLKNDITSFLR